MKGYILFLLFICMYGFCAQSEEMLDVKENLAKYIARLSDPDHAEAISQVRIDFCCDLDLEAANRKQEYQDDVDDIASRLAVFSKQKEDIEACLPENTEKLEEMRGDIVLLEHILKNRKEGLIDISDFLSVRRVFFQAYKASDVKTLQDLSAELQDMSYMHFKACVYALSEDEVVIGKNQ